MKKSIAFVLSGALLLTGCGGGTVCGVQYESYGLLNEDSNKNPDIAYEVSIASMIVGVIFFETIIVPIYVFGFDLYTPIGKKPAIKGAVATQGGC